MRRRSRAANLAAAGLAGAVLATGGGAWLVSAVALLYAAAARRQPQADPQEMDELRYAVVVARHETADLRAAVNEWSQIASERVGAMEARLQRQIDALRAEAGARAPVPPAAPPAPTVDPVPAPPAITPPRSTPSRRSPATIFRAFE